MTHEEAYAIIADKPLLFGNYAIRIPVDKIHTVMVDYLKALKIFKSSNGDPAAVLAVCPGVRQGLCYAFFRIAKCTVFNNKVGSLWPFFEGNECAEALTLRLEYLEAFLLIVCSIEIEYTEEKLIFKSPAGKHESAIFY